MIMDDQVVKKNIIRTFLHTCFLLRRNFEAYFLILGHRRQLNNFHEISIQFRLLAIFLSENYYLNNLQCPLGGLTDWHSDWYLNLCVDIYPVCSAYIHLIFSVNVSLDDSDQDDGWLPVLCLHCPIKVDPGLTVLQSSSQGRNTFII